MRFAKFLALACALLISSPVYAAVGQTGLNQSALSKVFTASTTDTVPSWANLVQVTYCGGGGGGENINSGNGGGSGSCWQNQWATVTGGSTLTITIGAGGASAVSGGTTSVTGTVQTLPLACGGNAGTASTGGRKGAGGGACSIGAGSWPSIPNTVGTIATNANYIPGQDGGATSTTETCFSYDGTTLGTAAGGNGGCSPYGKGGTGGGAGAGGAGSGFSAGGGGAGSASTTGGAGTGGIAFIRYMQ